MSAFWDYILGHPWAMEGNVFDRLQDVIHRHAVGERLSRDEITAAIGRAPDATDPRARKYEVADRVALIPVQGVLARHADQVGGVSQPPGTSYDQIRGHLAAAVADPKVDAIMLHVESPGGTVNGLRETVEAVRAAGQRKPIAAHVEGMAASAAYWLAAATQRVTSSDTALVGSIGTMAYLEDRSAKMAKDGIKGITLRSHPDKALGSGGEPIPEREIAHTQAIVNQLGAAFTASVAELRNLSDEVMATANLGRVHLPAAAQAIGLIDGVATFDEALAMLDASPSTTPPGVRQPAGASSNLSPTVRYTGPVLTAEQIAAIQSGLVIANGSILRLPNSFVIPTPDAAAPAPAATQEDPMKITAIVLCALVASYPTHAKLISDAAQAGDDEPAIKAKIGAADLAARDTRIAALEGEITKTKADHAAALKAEADAHAATRADLVKEKARADGLASLKNGAPPDVGGDPGAIVGVEGEAKWRAEFKASLKLQEDFALGGENSYVAHKKHEAKSRTKAA